MCMCGGERDWCDEAEHQHVTRSVMWLTVRLLAVVALVGAQC